MGHDLSEKGAGQALPTTSISTSDRPSTSDHDSSHHRSEKHTAGTPPDKKRDLNKPDSNVVQVQKEEAQDPLRNLPPDEAAILRRQVETPESASNYWSLYRYATFNDKIIVVVSVICAIAGGAALPLMTVIFGQLSGQFRGYFIGNTSREEFDSALAHNVLYFVYLAIGEFWAVYISTVGFIYTGEHISAKIRERYLEACLRQNIGFFDDIGAGEITTRITSDTNLVQDGISEKVGLSLAAVATFITAFVIGFIKFWKLVS